jgi:cytochrome c2
MRYSALCLVLVICFTTAASGEEPIAGATEYATNCAPCHSLEPGVNLFGPSLDQVFGRAAAKAPNFEYSASYVEASNSGLVWDAGSLSPFLLNPAQFLTDFLGHAATNEMPTRYPDQQVRERIIKYLSSMP